MMTSRTVAVALAGLLVLSSLTQPARATRRLVILRFDGLPYHLVEQYALKLNPQTGKPYLPWIKQVFFDHGVTFKNFYVRGMSISCPAWSILATGQHQAIKSNVEFDRACGRVEDYLNTTLSHLEILRGKRINLRPVEILDEVGVPLMEDIFPPDQKRLGMELIRRGTSWTAFGRIAQAKVESQSTDELLARFLVGDDMHAAFDQANELHLIKNLRDPRLLHLAAYYSVFDHHVHPDNSQETVVRALQAVDASVGRVYLAIQEAPLADETVLVVLSDHGFNTRPDVYSQGFNLVNYFVRDSWGGHHVLTKRATLHEFQLRSLNPLASSFINPSRESPYLKGKSDYPTMFIDYDGNERAALYFRNSDLNLLHILLLELKRNHPPEVKRALKQKFFEVIASHRHSWTAERREIEEELQAIGNRVAALQVELAAIPDDSVEGKQKRKELQVRARILEEYRLEYTPYLRSLGRLLDLSPTSFDPTKIRVEDVIRPRTFGRKNTIAQLQNYVIGLRDRRIHLTPEGRLDEAATFRTLNYFQLLKDFKVLNNVQPGVSSYPTDFIALLIPNETIRPALRERRLETTEDIIWLYGGEAKQALIIPRKEGNQLLLKYLPIARLQQTSSGEVRFDESDFQPNLPLKLWEDQNLFVIGDRQAWLREFHSDREWLEATHKTKYSTGLVGLHEVFNRELAAHLDQPSGAPTDRTLVNRFILRRRINAEPDLVLHANDHWNFNVRDFNPGGNHGGFFQASMHSTWMMWGGKNVPLKRGVSVETPYDSLSFVPTLFELIGAVSHGKPTEELKTIGFKSFPGPIAWEIFDGALK